MANAPSRSGVRVEAIQHCIRPSEPQFQLRNRLMLDTSIKSAVAVVERLEGKRIDSTNVVNVREVYRPAAAGKIKPLNDVAAKSSKNKRSNQKRRRAFAYPSSEEAAAATNSMTSALYLRHLTPWLLVNTTRPQHWRGLQRLFDLQAAPMLDFDKPVLS